MKNGLLLVLVFLFTNACNSDLDPIEEARIETEIDEVTNTLHESFFEFEVEGGDQNRSFEDSNEGLHGIYGVSRSDVDNLEGTNQNLFNCFQSIGLGLSRLNQLRNASRNFSICRFNTSVNYRSDFNVLLQRYEEERTGLIENHKGNLNGLQVHLIQLRVRFRAELLSLKESYSDDLRTCLRAFISEIRGILNNSQWEDFKECVFE